MTCLTRHHSALRDKTDEKRDGALRAMARLGWVNCGDSPGRALFKPFAGRCEKFCPLEPDAARRRQEWADSRK